MRTDESRPAESVCGRRHRFGGYAIAVLLALWRAARGQVGSATVESALPKEPPARARRILATIDGLLVLTLFAGLWIESSGGFELQIGEWSLRATSARGSIRIAWGLAFLRLWLTDAWGSRLLERALLHLSIAPRASRGLAFALGMVVIGCLGHGIAAVGEGSSQIFRGTSAPGISADSQHQHLSPLIREVVGHDGGGSIAVAIDDINPRGHLAAYYCYPRVLLMSPERARWCMTSRMTDARKLDPGHGGSAAAPPLVQDADWARARGVRFLAASNARTEEIAAEPVTNGPESR